MTRKEQKKGAKHSCKRNRNLVYRHRHFIKLLCSVKSAKKRNCLIDSAEPEDVFAVCECIFNILRGNVPIGKLKTSKLKRYKNTLRLVVKPELSLKRRKEALKQKGGFWPLLIPLIGTAISSILGR